MKCKEFIATFDSKKVKGYILFHKCPNRDTTTVSFNLYGIRPNQTHAIHIHMYGDTRRGCESLGPHYNPHKKNHGSILYDNINRHAGDLINNIRSNSKGEFVFRYEDNLLELSGRNSILGRSVVIHKDTDDLGLGGTPESLKTGSAGKRITCAIIGLSSSS